MGKNSKIEPGTNGPSDLTDPGPVGPILKPTVIDNLPTSIPLSASEAETVENFLGPLLALLLDESHAIPHRAAATPRVDE